MPDTAEHSPAHPAQLDRKPKRPRTSTACDACRKRAKPVCSRCTTMKLECLYAYDADKRKPVTKEMINAMQGKIDALEAELAALKTGKGVEDDVSAFTAGKSGTGGRPAVSDAFCGGLAYNSTGELRFYGPTSSYRAILSDGVGASAVEAARAWSLTRAPIPFAPPLDPHLPRRPPVLSRELSDKLIKLAFEFCFSQFQLVDERAFMTDLANSATLRTPNYSPLLLHVVLGIGSRYLDPDDPLFTRELCSDMDDVSTRGDVFIEWGRLMLDQEFYHPDISTIRSLTCLAVYLAGQALDGPALMFAAQAMRMVEDFGVHLDIHRLSIGSGGISQSLRSARRNAFFAAFQTDVGLCVYLGRQPLLSVADIDTALPPIENEIEYDEPAYRSSSFHAACKLINITSRLLDTVYSLKAGVSLAARQAAVPELHLSLEKWYHELPSPLRASTPTPSKAPHPHILGLNALYYATVVQLHRPFFHRTNAGGEAGVATEKCLSAAKNIVRLVKLQREAHGLRFVHPLFQYCCFTAGTILALSATEDRILGVPSRDLERKTQAGVDLKAIISALREIGKTWKTSLTSASVLEAFIQTWTTTGGSAAAGTEHAVPTGVSLPVVPAVPQAVPLNPPVFNLPSAAAKAVGPSAAPPPEVQTQAASSFAAGLTAASFPAIFPSWNLEAGDSTLDDFMNILHGAPEQASPLNFDFSPFGGQPP
ncbi:hypothetical protein JCM10213v2_005726 [Rhodosporidiobolus nylandii]